MDDEAFNMSVRKFLKKVGVTSQREIEDAVRAAGKSGNFTAKVTLEIEELDLSTRIDGEIRTDG